MTLCQISSLFHIEIDLTNSAVIAGMAVSLILDKRQKGSLLLIFDSAPHKNVSSTQKM
jgi:hypothetical protein